MTKDELVLITLKQLEESFKNSPECFHLDDSEIGQTNYPGPTIIWKFRVELDGKTIQDPNNATRTVIVTYNNMAKQLTTYIFFREVNNISNTIMADAVATTKYSEWPWLHKSYRKFNNLRKALLQKHREQENIEYIKKLSSIFPSTFEDDLFS